MGITGAQDQITHTVLGWDDTEVHPHRYGGVEYRLGKRELGHIHGDHLVDIPFPRRVRDEIVAAGQARPHHIQPESGWVSCFLRHPGDVAIAIQLLHRSYELARQQRRQRASAAVTETPREEEIAGGDWPTGSHTASKPDYPDD